MTNDLFVVVTANLVFIGVLPFVFFRRDGSFNFRWWFTGMPFFISGVALIAGHFGHLSPLNQLPPAATGALSALLALGSVGMICWTLGSHRVPLALWHQDSDAPVSIVTYGPYRYVRHPFYASFLMTQAAAVLAFPHWATGVGLVYAAFALSLTARREEKRLLKSDFGDEYRSYMAKTGRLLPGVGKLV